LELIYKDVELISRKGTQSRILHKDIEELIIGIDFFQRWRIGLIQRRRFRDKKALKLKICGGVR
jgi:hypothetical protein